MYSYNNRQKYQIVLLLIRKQSLDKYKFYVSITF